MHPLEGLPILSHYHHLLATPQEQHAWAVFDEFFDFYNEDTPQQYLWYMLTLALQSDNEQVDARHRGRMLWFYDYCVALFKAVYVLNKQQKNNKSGKKGKSNKKKKK